MENTLRAKNNRKIPTVGTREEIGKVMAKIKKEFTSNNLWIIIRSLDRWVVCNFEGLGVWEDRQEANNKHRICRINAEGFYRI